MKKLGLLLLQFCLFIPVFSQTALTIANGDNCGCTSACVTASICNPQQTGNCDNGSQTANTSANVPSGDYLIIANGTCGSTSSLDITANDHFIVSETSTSFSSGQLRNGACYRNNTGVSVSMDIFLQANRADEYITYEVTSSDPGGCTDISAMPVELSAFEAKVDLNQVQLNWITASEINNAYFSVEHSPDGINFLEIAQVEGKGTIRTTQKYSYTHASPLDGTNYYRLSQYDFDGSSEASSILAVNTRQKSIIPSLNPMLVQDYTLFQLGTIAKEDTPIEIFNLNGQFISRHVLKAGNTEQYIWLNNLLPGHYFAKVRLENSVQALRFVKH